MQIDLSKRKINRPEPKFKLTPKMVELKQKLNPIMWDIFTEFGKLHHKKGYHVKPERIEKELRDNYPDMCKKADELIIEYSKECFKEFYNENLEDVERKAFEGDRSSWLKLLRFDITCLEYEELREIIYKEHRRQSRKKGKSEFLKEVGRIISNPKTFHAGLKTDFYQLFLSEYNPKISIEKNLKKMEDNFKEGYLSESLEEDDVPDIPDKRQLRRVFKKK